MDIEAADRARIEYVLRTCEGIKDVAAVRLMSGPRRGALLACVVPDSPVKPLDLGIFFFADNDDPNSQDDYALYIEAAKLADELGFNAIWTPERHFTNVGAASPNPAVLTAAIAPITRRIQLRAGSVVAPLHDPIRIAEDWAVIDRLSGGRVALSFASGWVPNDFVFAPEMYEDRHEATLRVMDEVRTLWRGGSVARINGANNRVQISIRPRPIQPELRAWLTAAKSPATFEAAGRLGANVLTALLHLTVEQLSEYVAIYREAREQNGHDPSTGKVAVMLHAYVAESAEQALTEAAPVLLRYFNAQAGLREEVARDLGHDIGAAARHKDHIIELSVARYLASKTLIGSGHSCKPMLSSLASADVDEIACLIDFGIDPKRALESLTRLDSLRRSQDEKVCMAELQAHLQSLLPPHLRPSELVCLQSIPRNGDGEADMTRLLHELQSRDR